MAITPQHVNHRDLVHLIRVRISNFFTINLLLGLIFLTGCSSVQVYNTENINWEEISTIAIIGPDTDRWDIKSSLDKELTAMGFTVSPDQSNSDLLLTYATSEARDIGDDSEILIRLKSLHLYFEDPVSQNRLATADYLYPSTGTIDPADGVIESLAAVKQRRQTGEASAQSQARQSPPPETIRTNEAAAPSATSSSTSKESQSPPTTTTQEQEQKQIQQQKSESPWSIKLQSWGFDEWGKDKETDSDD